MLAITDETLVAITKEVCGTIVCCVVVLLLCWPVGRNKD